MLPAIQAIAFHWFQLAAAQGNPTAEYNLALAYERGEGVPKDSAEAEKWYTKAAESGVPYAAMADRRDCDQRATIGKTALKWLRPAAAQGLTDGADAAGHCL